MSIFNHRRAHRGRSTARLSPRPERLEDRVVLSTFRVNTTLDTVAVNFQKGKDATGHISLRSAIMAADAKGGSNKIILPAGTFTLTIARRRRGRRRHRRPGYLRQPHHQGQERPAPSSTAITWIASSIS